MQGLSDVCLEGDFKLAALASGEAEALGVQFAGMEPWAKYASTPAALAVFFAQNEPGAPRFALRKGGELAGLAIVRMNWLRGPYLQFLGLLPAFQNKGLGGQFLDWLEAQAGADGHRHVWIMVSDFNTPARTFYARKGYEEIGAVPDVVKDGFTEILLRKRV